MDTNQLSQHSKVACYGLQVILLWLAIIEPKLLGTLLLVITFFYVIEAVSDMFAPNIPLKKRIVKLLIELIIMYMLAFVFDALIIYAAFYTILLCFSIIGMICRK